MSVAQILLWALYFFLIAIGAVLALALFVPFCMKLRVSYNRRGDLLYDGLCYIFHPVFYRYKFNQNIFDDLDVGGDDDVVCKDNVSVAADEKIIRDDTVTDTVIKDHITKNYPEKIFLHDDRGDDVVGDDVVGDVVSDVGDVDDVNIIDDVGDENFDGGIDEKEQARLDAMYNMSDKKSKKKESVMDKIKRNKLYKIWADKPVRQKILKWLVKSPKHFIKLVRVKKFHVRVTLGLNDPAKLGATYGYVVAAKSVLPRSKNIAVEFTPIFCEKRFEIDGDIFIKTSLARVLHRTVIIAALFPILKVRKIWRGRA